MTKKQIKIWIINSSPRSENDCPQEKSKSERIAEFMNLDIPLNIQTPLIAPDPIRLEQSDQEIVLRKCVIAARFGCFLSRNQSS